MKKDLDRDNNILLKIISIVVMILYSFPKEAFDEIRVGLDPSWGYAINVFFDKGIVFGRDVVFTYGPLGFLCNTRNVGNNITISLVFWLLMLFIQARLLYHLFFKNKAVIYKKIILIVSVFFYVTSAPDPSYYLCYLGIVSLFCAWRSDIRIFAVTDIILALTFFIKFSSFFILLSAVMIFIILSWIFKISHRIYYTLSIIVTGMVTAGLYLLLYEHSIKSFLRYVYGGIQVASGYNVAMTSPIYDIFVFWVVLVIAAYLICCLLCYKISIDNFVLCLTCAGPLFFCYKHGFVRADGHIYWSFSGLLWVLSVIVIFFDWDSLSMLKKNKQLSGFAIASSIICLVPLLYLGRGSSELLAILKSRVIEFPNTIQAVLAQDVSGLNKLPDNIIDEVGDSSVSIYPEEVSYLASNELNYRPLPVVQIYSTYTPYLDHITANYYNNETAPQYIILSRNTIDNRWGFIECPETWREIKNNYRIELYDSGLYLLKRKTEIPNIEYELSGIEDVEKTQIINVNEKNGYVKVNAKLNLWGRLAKFFWKIPEVNMVAEYENGALVEHRVLLDNLSNGVDFSSLVNDDDTFVDYINYEGNLSNVKYVSFSGSGLKYYQNNIKLMYYIPQENFESKSYTIPSYQLYTEAAEMEDFDVYSENHEGHYGIENEEKTSNYCKISGWAFDNRESSGNDVYLECGGIFYKARKVKREDVQNVFLLNTPWVGFEVLLDKEVQDYRIYIVDTNSLTFFKINR